MKDLTARSSSSGIGVGSRQSIQLDYTKIKSVADENGLAIIDVAMDGDCALHAVIRQLHQQGIHQSYDARILRQLAVQYLEAHFELVNMTTLGMFTNSKCASRY